MKRGPGWRICSSGEVDQSQVVEVLQNSFDSRLTSEWFPDNHLNEAAILIPLSPAMLPIFFAC